MAKNPGEGEEAKKQKPPVPPKPKKELTKDFIPKGFSSASIIDTFSEKIQEHRGPAAAPKSNTTLTGAEQELEQAKRELKQAEQERAQAEQKLQKTLDQINKTTQTKANFQQAQQEVKTLEDQLQKEKGAKNAKSTSSLMDALVQKSRGKRIQDLESELESAREELEKAQKANQKAQEENTSERQSSLERLLKDAREELKKATKREKEAKKQKLEKTQSVPKERRIGKPYGFKNPEVAERIEDAKRAGRTVNIKELSMTLTNSLPFASSSQNPEVAERVAERIENAKKATKEVDIEAQKQKLGAILKFRKEPLVVDKQAEKEENEQEEEIIDINKGRRDTAGIPIAPPLPEFLINASRTPSKDTKRKDQNVAQEFEKAPRKEAVVLKGRDFARAFHEAAQAAIIDGKFDQKIFKQAMKELLGNPLEDIEKLKIEKKEDIEKLKADWKEAETRIDKKIDALAAEAEKAHKAGSLKFSSNFSRACKKFLHAVITTMSVIVSAALVAAPTLFYHYTYKDRYFLPEETEPLVAKGAAGLATVVMGLIVYKKGLWSPKAKPYANALSDLTSSFEKELDIITKKAAVYNEHLEDENNQKSFAEDYLNKIKNPELNKKTR